MNLKPLCLLIFCFNCCFSQEITIKEIKLSPASKYYKTNDQTIIYPIILTGNTSIDSIINEQIKVGLFSPDDNAESIKEVLDENINDYGLTYLSYKITYNRHQLLSITIDEEGCGAHCSNWNTYFNFDLNDGKKLAIEDLIIASKLDSFSNIVLNDKRKALKNYKTEAEKAMKKNDIDSTTYSWSVELADECNRTVDISNFSILDTDLVINNDCEFPNAIRSQQPNIELKYSFRDVSSFVKPEFRFLLK